MPSLIMLPTAWIVTQQHKLVSINAPMITGHPSGGARLNRSGVRSKSGEEEIGGGVNRR